MPRGVRPDEVQPDPGFLDRTANELPYFLETCLQIVPKEGGLVPLKLNPEQIELLRLVGRLQHEKRPVRIIVLKARQMGISTLIEGIGYHLVSTRRFMTGLVLSHERESARWLLTMSQRFATYDTRHHRGGMPKMSNLNKNELTFDNPDARTRMIDPGLGSSLTIATADNRGAGHSKTLQFFHGSEVARWKSPELLAGVLNAIPDGQGMVFLESTANGPAGAFYDYWTNAVAGANEFAPLFLSWTARPEYRVAIPRGMVFEPTKEEERLTLLHGLEADQLLWRRIKIASPACQGQGRVPEDVFREQYPLSPEEAFVSTGKQYFDLRISASLLARAKTLTTELGDVELVGELPKKLRDPKPAVKFVPRKGGYVRIWRQPEPGHDYVLGADVAAGISGGDYQTGYVMDRMSLEYVARIRCLEDPERYADDLMALGWFYNEAFLAPEANSIGLIVAKRCQKHYSRLCYHTSLESTDLEMDTDRPGWYTTSANRRQMFADFRQALMNNVAKIWCEDFHHEVQTFVVPEGIHGQLQEGAPRAMKRKHDDAILAATITWWVNNPEIAGVIRRPKPVTEHPDSWQRAAMMKHVEEEQKKRRERVFDDHVGEL